jgi:hypothetical protein
MRWLKHTVSVVLILAAVGVVLATAFSDHSQDYGQVVLPQGGTVHLPEGKVAVYYRVLGDSSEISPNTGGLAFSVVPASGGPPIAMALPNGQTNTGCDVLDRWRLVAGLVIRALLISVIPVPRSGRRWEDPNGGPTGWSSEPRAPYAG